MNSNLPIANYFQRPTPEWGGAFDLPEPMPALVAEKHQVHRTAHADYYEAVTLWAAYVEAHPKPTDEDLDALADAINADHPLPAASVVGELARLHGDARLASRRLDRSRLDLARAIVNHRNDYLAALVAGIDRDVAEYARSIAVLEDQSQALGERAAGVDFIRDFDIDSFEWATFEMRSRRFRIVRGGLPVFVDIDLGTDILPHLHADCDAMLSMFGTLEDKAEETNDDEADETDGDAE